ncbi:hypothetical protein [Ottowia thiooxydans]|uniref:hypothetical protein n=1 Tax=Ottowia thiooxydans TaxID=219182 RepID=UPI000405A2D6|nr:hypothetical protein [Ottowia thiooxydans]
MPFSHLRFMSAFLANALLVACPALAQTAPLCASDGQPAPRVLLERFINADCASCWKEATSKPRPGALVLDWVAPGHLAQDAPLSAVAQPEALERLISLGITPPEGTRSNSSKVEGGPHRLRVAHGLVLNGYVGASLRFDSKAKLAKPLTGWLALVEQLPAGTADSPVSRTLVRNLLSEPISPRSTGTMGQFWRTMDVPESAHPERLAVMGWVSDSNGRVLSAALSRCTPRR